MLKKFLHWILAILAIFSVPFFLMGRSDVLAQNINEPPGFKNVHLWINPEYDDPRLLVMLEGQIDGVNAPATIRFLVPSAAEMYSAGSIDSNGKYSGGPPARQQSSQPGWDEISYEVKTDTFRVEYYDPNILGQTNKSISYEFLRLYPISNLQVIIQQPRSSTGFNVTPAGSSYTDTEGFNTMVYSYNTLPVEMPVSFLINYTKTDSRPSLNIKDSSTSNSLTIIMIVVIVAVVIAGIFFWSRKSQAKPKRNRARAPKPDAEIKQANRFCGQCGKPVDRSDKYCPNCGSKNT